MRQLFAFLTASVFLGCISVQAAPLKLTGIPVVVPSGKYPTQAPQSLDFTVRVPVGASGGLPTSGTLFAFPGSSGLFKLAIDSNGNTVWTTRGSTSTSVPQSTYWLPAGGELQVRAYYDAAAGGDNALLLLTNGVNQWPFVSAQGGPSGPGINIPSSGSIGSDSGSDPWLGGSPRAIVSFGQSHAVAVPELGWFGDSTSSISSVFEAVAHEIYTPSQWWTRPGIGNFAAPGTTVADMKARWQSYNTNPLRGQAGLKAFVYIIGVNNVIAGDSTATILAAIQDLRNTVAADNPTAKHVIGLMTPCHGSLGDSAYAVWQGVNAGIPGLTGFNAVVSSYVAALGTGADYLAPTYDYGDGLHPNNLARKTVMAPAFVTALQGLGLLP